MTAGSFYDCNGCGTRIIEDYNKPQGRYAISFVSPPMSTVTGVDGAPPLALGCAVGQPYTSVYGREGRADMQYCPSCFERIARAAGLKLVTKQDVLEHKQRDDEKGRLLMQIGDLQSELARMRNLLDMRTRKTVQTQLTRSPLAAFTTDEPFMWVLHTAETTKIVQVTFRLMGTGHILEGENWKYLGTFQLRGGALVFHLFVEEPYGIARRVVEESATPGTKKEG